LSSTFISGEKAFVASEVRKHLMLVVEMPASGVQRSLVERREYDAVEPVGKRELDHVRERCAANASRLGRYGAASNAARVEIVQVDDWNLVARPIDVFGRAVRVPREGNASVAHALLEHASIADDQQARDVGRAPVRKDARALLGADAGRVAEHQAEHGKRLERWRGHLSLASVKR